MEWISSWQTFKLAAQKVWALRHQVFYMILWQIIALAIVYFIIFWLQFAYQIPFFSVLGLMIILILLLALLLFQLGLAITMVEIVSGAQGLAFRRVFALALRKVIPAFILLIVLLVIVSAASLLLVIPGLILAVFYVLAFWILIIEGTGVIASLKRSKSLIKGWWWPMLGRIIFFSFIIACVSMFSIVPQTGPIVSGILGLFLTPVLLTYFWLTYQQLTELKERQGINKSAMSFPAKFLMGVATLLVFMFIFLVNLLVDSSKQAVEADVYNLIRNGDTNVDLSQ